MTNYEEQKTEIDTIIERGICIAVNKSTKKVVLCPEIACAECLFFKRGSAGCGVRMMEWLVSEYKEPEVDWSKVAVDTPVLVSNDKKIWVRRHFATPALKNDDSFTVRTFADGKTEWSSTAMREEELESCERWRYAKLAEVE